MITIQDMAYVRYQAPDLDRMEAFLADFGLRRAARTATTLYMRGYSAAPYLHVTDLGPQARSVGFGLLANSRTDLEQLASECSAQVEPNPEPAGGSMVRLTDPSGFKISVHADVVAAQALAVRERFGANDMHARQRKGGVYRQRAAPSHACRLGHVALRCSHLEESFRFYTERLGFKVSDRTYVDTPDNVVGYFLYCGLGRQYTDHHSIAIFKRPASQIDHCAFEVRDWDDLMSGHTYLQRRGYAHQWGIGRHVEGSQVFDYWRDPFDNKIEHWTDGDLVNDDYAGTLVRASSEGLWQWGPEVPEGFYR